MELTVISVLILFFILVVILITRSQGGSHFNNDIHSGAMTSEAVKIYGESGLYQNTDDEIIDEILSSKEISRVELQQLPWKNRKYKNYSAEKLEEMHKELMNNWREADLETKSKITKEVGNINSEFMVRRQIRIHRMTKIPVNIGDSNDEDRLTYLLEEKMKNYLYKVQSEEGDYFNSQSIVNDRINSLQTKYKDMGFDEEKSSLLAKCELLNVKLEPEPSSPNVFRG